MIIDRANDKFACTGDFELIHECPIARFCPPQMIQLNVDGKKLMPPQKPRKLFNMRKISDLIIRGEKLLKPKSRCRNQKIPMQTKLKTENLLQNQNFKNEKKNFYIKPMKIYRSPKIERNIFRTIIVKPSSTDPTDYVRKLPAVLQGTGQKFVNLNDLMRCLKINERKLSV